MTISLDELTKAEPKRDRYGRPLIIPKGGGKPKAYTRPTTIADTLDDRYNLEQWKQRQVLLGTVARPDLHALAATTAADDKKALNKLCEQLMDAAASDKGANMGTAVHAAVEAANRDESFAPMFEADVQAYWDALQAVGATVDPDHVEQFVVNETVGAAGTFDMRLRIDDTWYIADLKTGSTVEWSAKAFAIQLAIYAGHTSTYDWATETHGEPLEVSQDRGVIVHLPAGTGECTLHWIDLDAGREALEHALWVRKWRNRKDLLTPVAQGGTVDAEPSSPGTNSGTVERPDRGSRPAPTTGSNLQPMKDPYQRPARIAPLSTTVDAPDEVGAANDADYAALQDEGKAASKDAIKLVLRWRAQPKGVWRWVTSGDDGKVTVRRVAISRAALALAEFCVRTASWVDEEGGLSVDQLEAWKADKHDATARAALEEVIGDDVQTHPVGEILARLTPDECRRLMEVLA